MTAMTYRLIRGVPALAALLAVVVGLPALLIRISADVLPSRVSSAELWLTLLSPDDGRVLVGALLVAAWGTWATLMISFVVELPAQLRRARAPRLPGLGLQQRLIGVLIAAVIGLVAAPTALAAPSAQAADAPPTSVGQPATASVGQSPGRPAASAEPSTRSAADPGLQRTAEPQSDDGGSRGPARRTHTVRQGDSLSSIAASRLGSANDWPRLLAANRKLVRDPDLIRPGWLLELPGDDRTTAGDRSAGRQHRHVVRPGETLWGIAEDELGDAERWPSLVVANPRLAHDPDVLGIGWVLVLPAKEAHERPADTAPGRRPSAAVSPATHPTSTVPTPTTPTPTTPTISTPTTPTTTPTPASSTPTASAPATSAPATSVPATSAPATSVPATQAQPQRAEAAAHLRWGAGAVLAAGIVGLLGALRGTQRRRRRAGERLHFPDLASLRETETTVQAVADSELVVRLDRALRELAARCRVDGRPLPPLRAARLTSSQIELYLARADQLPEPWLDLSAGTVWATGVTDVVAVPDDNPLLADLRAPYPALVTVGHDQDDALLLLDLEETGSLAVSGDEETVHAALAAFSIELATSRWVDDSQVTLVGVLPELASAVRTGRLRHVDHLELLLPELEERVREVPAVLAADGATDLREARGLAVADDAWTPEIVVLGDGVPNHLRERMAAVVARSHEAGIVAITGGGDPLGEWVLTTPPFGSSGPTGSPGSLGPPGPTGSPATAESPHGTLSPAGITVRCQGVSAAELEMIISLLREADRPPQAGPGWSAPSHPAEPSLAQLPGPSETRESTGETAGDATPAPVHIFPRATPRLTILGRVDLQHAAGPEPVSFGSDTASAASQHAKATELVGYLALHREGASLARIADALYPGRELRLDRTAKLLSRTRRWLGARTTGELWIPRVEGDGPVMLDPELRTDWDDVRELIGESLRTAPTDRLRAALGLVSDRPFSGTGPGSWAWVEPFREELTAALVDLVHEVADRSIRVGAAETAREVLTLGRRLDPDSELLWRDALRAEYVAGDPLEQARLTRQLLEQIDVLEIDLDPATTSLLADLDRASGQ